MTLPIKTKFAAVLSVVALLLADASQAADDDRFDIVGLHLGMTLDETVRALTDYGIDPSNIQEQRQTYTYSDGVNGSISTEPFVHRITAAKQARVDGERNSDSFSIYFSPPPEGGRLVAIQRLVQTNANPPTNAEYRAALREKYGEATEAVLGDRTWMFGTGTQDCLPKGLPSNRGNNILKMVFMPSGSQVQLDHFLNSRVTSLDDCAHVLKYGIGSIDTQPAKQVTATMVDVQSWVRAELAASAWVDRLRQEAIEKRASSADKPAL